MSLLIVKKSKVQGNIRVPPSKSQTLRAILFAALAKGKSHIKKYLPSPDTLAMCNTCRLLGAQIIIKERDIEVIGIDGKIIGAEDVINVGNSGITLRFISAIAALGSQPIIITGDPSICNQRPMQPLLDGLSQLGINAISTRGNGYAPLLIKGPLSGGKTTIQGQDSQPVSALLIASALAKEPTEMIVKNAGEKPWISMTLDWFDRLKIPYNNEDFEHYYIPGNSSFDGFTYTVPGDWSSAAFPVATALVTESELTIHDIDIDDPQGDKELIFALQRMGANIELSSRSLHVKRGARLRGITIDINDFVDAIPILAVIACHAEGETNITNAAVTKTKECDRIHCLATELRKMGADVTEREDGLQIRGRKLKGANLNSYHDHRMVMALTIAGLNAEGTTTIRDMECVSKTYPSFVHDFKQIQAKIKVSE